MFCGDSAEELLKIKDNSVDMLCSDPPYGYSMMGKDWDKVLPNTEIWRQSYRVLKAGAFITVMAAPRTDVLWRISRDLEEAGFDLSFTNIEWVYHSGFPKATDISKSIDKRGGTFTKDLGKMLKDAREAKGLSLNDVAIYFPSKTGGITGCVWNWESGTNYPTTEQLNQLIELLGLDLEKTQALYGKVIGTKTSGIGKAFTEDGWGSGSDEVDITEPESDLAKKYEGSKAGFQPKPAREIIIVGMKPFSEGSYIDKVLNFEALPDNVKMTYPLIQTPKPSKKEKDFGIGENIPLKQRAWLSPQSRTTSEDYTKTSAGHERWLTQPKRNSHPTVKPIKLMSYLITLFTRPGDWILDPFGGSGTTGLACKLLDRNHIYIDFTEEYYDIAQERLQVSKEDLKKLLKEKISNGQQELF
jgi:site-specific DNA-methyltransferase (adenine-specific)